jgi:hypothetical protein
LEGVVIHVARLLIPGLLIAGGAAVSLLLIALTWTLWWSAALAIASRLGLGRLRAVGAVLVLGLLLAACAAGPNPQAGSAAADGVIAGFWLGLWHGVIAPVTFAISLFTDSVNIYEVHNSGNWYNFGFFLGFGVLLGGGASGGRAR